MFFLIFERFNLCLEESTVLQLNRRSDEEDSNHSAHGEKRKATSPCASNKKRRGHPIDGMEDDTPRSDGEESDEEVIPHSIMRPELQKYFPQERDLTEEEKQNIIVALNTARSIVNRFSRMDAHQQATELRTANQLQKDLLTGAISPEEYVVLVARMKKMKNMLTTMMQPAIIRPSLPRQSTVSMYRIQH